MGGRAEFEEDQIDERDAGAKECSAKSTHSLRGAKSSAVSGTRLLISCKPLNYGDSIGAVEDASGLGATGSRVYQSRRLELAVAAA